MKNLVLLTTAAVAIAGVAQAEVSFVKGTASFVYSQISDEDFSFTDTDASVAFSMGTYGFQIDAGLLSFSEGSETLSSNAAHAYYQAANGNKYGAYMGSSFFISEYGVEGMFALGPVDVEVFAGVLSEFYTDAAHAGIGVYFDVTDDLEISVTYDSLFQTSGGSDSIDYYTIGASYDIPNTDLAVIGQYSSYDDSDLDVYGIGIEWSFGPDQGERLFGKRSIPFIFIGV